MRDTSVKKCLVGCETTGRLTRGLCNNCYPAARVRVKKGIVTWEALEKAGLALPATGIGRSRVSAFAQKMAEAGLSPTTPAAPSAFEQAKAEALRLCREPQPAAQQAALPEPEPLAMAAQGLPPWKQKAQ